MASMEDTAHLRFETYQWKIDKWTNKPWLVKYDTKGVWSRPLNIKDENKIDNFIQLTIFLTKASRLLLAVSFVWFIATLNIYLKEKA